MDTIILLFNKPIIKLSFDVFSAFGLFALIYFLPEPNETSHLAKLKLIAYNICVIILAVALIYFSMSIGTDIWLLWL